MTFGKRLRQLRNEFNLTQTQLAEKISLSKANVSKYEADTVEPNLQTLRLLSNFFNVSIDYLLCMSNDRTGGSYWISLDELDNIDLDAIPEGTVFATMMSVTAPPELVKKFEDKLKSIGIDYEYKIKAIHEGPPLSVESSLDELDRDLLSLTSSMNDDEKNAVLGYAAHIVAKHKKED